VPVPVVIELLLFVLRNVGNTEIPSLSKVQKFINAKAGGTCGNRPVVKGYDVGFTVDFICSRLITSWLHLLSLSAMWGLRLVEKN